MHMKTLVSKTIAALLIVISVVSESHAAVPVKVTVAGEKSIELFLGEISGKVWISFTDQKGLVFYSKKIKDLTSYKVKYDLAAFPDGNYQLELNASNQQIKVPVTIVNGIVMLKEELANAPVVSNDGNVVEVKLNSVAKSDWNVTIQDTTGELIFKETVANKYLAKRKYDLSNLNSGMYTLHFNIDGNSFSHDVVVKN